LCDRRALGDVMGRSFQFWYNGKLLTIRPLPIDEGWELWVVEGERKVACGARISVDEAVQAGRRGLDYIAVRVEEMKSDILLSKLHVQ
jgi:hypothetical protein